MDASECRDYFSERKEFSKMILSKVRKVLAEHFGSESFCIVADGSYARYEASPESDIDFYVIGEFTTNKTEEIIETVNGLIKQIVPNMPSQAGAFATVCSKKDIMTNIGGNKDENADLTRRILLLLEGDWLYNEEMFFGIKRELLSTYVTDDISQKQLALFLLNDIIRYYRTVCVDFNYKTIEAEKPWGIRNIKLVFSRKLLYFCGIIAVAETANMTAEQKRAKLFELLSLPPIERFQRICRDRHPEVLEIYCYFLKEISNPEVRIDLKLVSQNRESHSPKFRELKNLSYKFSHELIKSLRLQYDQSHPIHRMLIV